MSRARNYCFTSYDVEIKIVPDPVVRYYVYQQEVCPETGRKHWQGYIEFHTAVRYSSVKAIIGDPKVHLEKRKGSAKQASDYCKKADSAVPGSQVEWGKMAHQGERIDIHEALDDIRNGVQSEAHDVFLLRYPRGYQCVRDKYDIPPRRDDIKLVYVYGPPRCGKSRYAWEHYPDGYRMRDYNVVWLDNYKGEKTIIIDEFIGATPIQDMLQLCDRYPVRMPVKGGHVSVHATTIVFTSNYAPEDVYQNSRQQEAWLGRLKDFGTVIRYPVLSLRTPSEKGGSGGSPPDSLH